RLNDCYQSIGLGRVHAVRVPQSHGWKKASSPADASSWHSSSVRGAAPILPLSGDKPTDGGHGRKGVRDPDKTSPRALVCDAAMPRGSMVRELLSWDARR